MVEASKTNIDLGYDNNNYECWKHSVRATHDCGHITISIYKLGNVARGLVVVQDNLRKTLSDNRCRVRFNKIDDADVIFVAETCTANTQSRMYSICEGLRK